MESQHRATRGQEHEAGLAYFIEPSYRPRFRWMLTSRRRRTLLDVLWHFRHIDVRFAEALGTDHPYAVLIANGAPDSCYVVSEGPDLDGRSMALSDAIDALWGGWAAAFVSCIPGELAYFEGEAPTDRYILLRKRKEVSKDEGQPRVK